MARRFPPLEDFLQMEYPPNLDISYKTIRCYMRKGRVLIDGEVHTALTIANITNSRRARNGVFNPKHKRTGLFSEFETFVRQMALQYGYDGVYVELVHNEFLPDVLVRYGYKRVNIRGIPEMEEKNYWYCVRDNQDERRL